MNKREKAIQLAKAWVAMGWDRTPTLKPCPTISPDDHAKARIFADRAICGEELTRVQAAMLGHAYRALSASPSSAAPVGEPDFDADAQADAESGVLSAENLAAAYRSYYRLGAASRPSAAMADNPAAKILSHRWLDPVCVEDGCQSLCLKVAPLPPAQPTDEALVEWVAGEIHERDYTSERYEAAREIIRRVRSRAAPSPQQVREDASALCGEIFDIIDANPGHDRDDAAVKVTDLLVRKMNAR